jgi:cation transport regulator ChaB
MSTPIQTFMTDKFRDQLIQLYSKGDISKKTLVEVVGNQNFEHEVLQRKQEAKDGLEYFMFPPVIQNVEQMGVSGYPYNPPATPKGVQAPDIEQRTTQDKIDPVQRQNFNMSSIMIEALEGAPYTSIASLPENVKEAIPSVKGRRRWLSTFNGSYKFYMGKWGDKRKAEEMAFKTAWAHSAKD